VNRLHGAPFLTTAAAKQLFCWGLDLDGILQDLDAQGLPSELMLELPNARWLRLR
jgi:hypothetical protein